jgi:hypothetical protein
VVGGQIRFLDGAYAKQLNLEPVGFQFPEGYKPWGEYVPEFGGGD